MAKKAHRVHNYSFVHGHDDGAVKAAAAAAEETRRNGNTVTITAAMSLLLGWGLRGFWAGWLAGEKRDLAKSGTIVGLFSENGLLWARCQCVTGCVEPPPRVLSFNELL